VRAILDLLVAAKPAAAAGSDQGRDWLVFGLAAYGAALSSVLAFRQFVRDRPGVTLRIVPVVSEEAEGRIVERWMVRIVNHRQRPISIDGAGVLVENGAQLQSPYVDVEGNAVNFPFPQTLTDGQHVRVFKKVIATKSADVTGAWAQDALGRIYTVRYPSRSPRARWRAWRLNRKLKRALRHSRRRQKN
jgi:hypothetical protein